MSKPETSTGEVNPGHLRSFVERIERLVLESFRRLVRKADLIADLRIDPATFAANLPQYTGGVTVDQLAKSAADLGLTRDDEIFPLFIIEGQQDHPAQQVEADDGEAGGGGVLGILDLAAEGGVFKGVFHLLASDVDGGSQPVRDTDATAHAERAERGR